MGAVCAAVCHKHVADVFALLQSRMADDHGLCNCLHPHIHIILGAGDKRGVLCGCTHGCCCTELLLDHHLVGNNHGVHSQAFARDF